MPRRAKSDNTSPSSSNALALASEPERVEQVVRWLLSGARDADVVEAIRTTWPSQELQPLITKAVEDLAASAEFDSQVVRGFCFEATKDLYRRMVEIGDFAGALRAVKQLADLAA